jgi:hypothetical protein
MKTPTIAIVPEDVINETSGFKSGDEFHIEMFNNDRHCKSFIIKSPKTGNSLFCLTKGCAHLPKDKNWILK